MKIGYARTSTTDQAAGYEAQLKELELAGCERIFSEQVSSVKERKELASALDFARAGDTFVVCKLDRLARSIRHLVDVVDLLATKNVALKILNIGLDTDTPTGKLMLNMLGSVAQFEREILLERQRDGIAKAKLEGKYKGRVGLAPSTKKTILMLADAGMQREEIARATACGVATVYRTLANRP